MKKNLIKWRYAIVILAIVTLGIFSPDNISKNVRNIFWNISRPVGLVGKSTLGNIFPFFKEIFHLRAIVKQNNNLLKENLDLQSKLAKLTETGYENEILKKELGFLKSEESSKTIPAAVIGQSSGYLKSLVIDKGENSKIKKGDGVISQGVLIGKVTDVRRDNSEITLVTDYNSLVPVILENSRGTGLLRGGLSGIMVEDIPLNIGIQKEENVVSSGLGGQIPSGILIGKVSGIISKEGEIFQKVTVTSPVNFSRLQVVFVVVSENL